jgi:hypothetical protein
LLQFVKHALENAERQELERAVDQIGRTTRPGRLLEFLGSKYFSQQEAQLTEFDIAREVFGRSLENFDPAADAVVRVEIHRLRKKLRELYEKDKREHGVQISLPAGTYIPKFTAHEQSSAPVHRSTAWRGPALGILGLIAIVTVIVLATRKFGHDVPEPTTASAAAATSSAGATPHHSELHIMAGYFGGEVIDNSGTRWTSDRYYSRGGVWSRESGFVRATSRQFLFKTYRTGEFSYDIPLAPGSYELRLFSVAGQPGEDKVATFAISLNGSQLMTGYDISMSANGPGVADELVFRDVRPNANGILQLGFSNETSTPILNALEVTPGTPGRLKPIRILTQRTSFVDHKGQRWRADDYYDNGILMTDRRKVAGTEDPELFSGERFGHFSYAIPVDRRGRYTVVLHFAEFYYGPMLPGGGGVGSRVFHVFCNGQTLLRDFDIYKESGSLRLVTKTFPHIQPSAFGKINLTFEAVNNNATVSGIEVIEESGS